MLTLREGKDVALVATGSTVHEVVEAAQQLADLGGPKKRGHKSPADPPGDERCRREGASPCGSVITVEEHNVNGGLGSLVAEVLAEAGVGMTLQRLGIPDGVRRRRRSRLDAPVPRV